MWHQPSNDVQISFLEWLALQPSFVFSCVRSVHQQMAGGMNPLAGLLICGRISDLHLADSKKGHAIGETHLRTVTYEREDSEKPIDCGQMTKILHTADIHLDSPLRSLAMRDEALREKVQTATRTAFSRIVDAAIEEGAAALLISGDLFDGAVSSARTGAFLLNQIDRLRKAEIGVFYVKGNHDAESTVTRSFLWPDNVHVFGAAGDKVELEEGVWIHGVSTTPTRLARWRTSRTWASIIGHSAMCTSQVSIPRIHGLSCRALRKGATLANRDPNPPR